MEEVTLEISARFTDEASQPMTTLVALGDRLGASMDAMRTRMSLAGAEARGLANTLERVQALGGAPGGGFAGARDESAAGRVEERAAAGPDAEGAQAALNAFASALEGGAGSSAAALGVLENSALRTAEESRGLGAGMQSAAYGARAAASGLGRSGDSAQDAASRLKALGAAAGELKSRFAAFRMPSIAAHAAGGILSTPHMGLVAEQGPEAIIPLSANRRGRGVELLRQAGRALGVREYADGGMPAIPPAPGPGGGINMGGVNVNIDIRSDAAPEAALEQSGERIADDVARAIAAGLEQALRNMA